MNAIDMLKQTRALLARNISNLSEDQLLHVPTGFRNNILWNVGHIVVAQQVLHYRLSGREMHISEKLLRQYGRGTSPADWDATPDIACIKHLLSELPGRLQEDYDQGYFAAFRRYTTSAGVVLHDIDDAIAFNNYHEGLHAGVTASLAKLVTS